MAQIDLAEKRVALKIVYFGPAMGGKTTNVVALHTMLPESRRDVLQTIDDEHERTVFFDFTPIDARTRGGFEITFRVYTVSGQENESDSRSAVLAGVDGVVFVADVSQGRIEDNLRSITELRQQLEQLDSTGDQRVPIVLQYNKLDLDAREEAGELRAALESGVDDIVFASAVQQRGVVEAFESACRLAAGRI